MAGTLQVFMVILGIFNFATDVFGFKELFESEYLMPWSSAVAFCDQNNGRLLVVDSQEKYDLFIEHDSRYHANALSDDTYWIGLSTTTDDCTDYLWLTGSPLSWTRWYPYSPNQPEPNFCASEFCVRFHMTWMRTTRCENNCKALCEIIIPMSTMTSSFEQSTVEAASTPSPTLKVETTSTKEMTSTDVESMSTSTPKFQLEAVSIKEITASMSTLVEESSSDAHLIQKSMNKTSSTPESTHDDCGECCYTRYTNITIPSTEELAKIMESLKAELLISKSNTSAHRRRLISVYDSQPRSVAIGSLGICLLVLVLGLIVLPDIFKLASILLSSCQLCAGNKANPT